MRARRHSSTRRGRSEARGEPRGGESLATFAPPTAVPAATAANGTRPTAIAQSSQALAAKSARLISVASGWSIVRALSAKCCGAPTKRRADGTGGAPVAALQVRQWVAGRRCRRQGGQRPPAPEPIDRPPARPLPKSRRGSDASRATGKPDAGRVRALGVSLSNSSSEAPGALRPWTLLSAASHTPSAPARRMLHHDFAVPDWRFACSTRQSRYRLSVVTLLRRAD
jgi:hypothetical protein